MDINKLILKFTRRGKRPQIADTILEEMDKIEGQSLPNFMTYDKAIIFKTVYYWFKNRQIDQ